MTLAPLAWVFDGVGRVRNAFYDRGWLPSKRLPTTVVSIGNLTVGGTGKTPTTDLLVSLLREKNLSVAVLSRGYGGLQERVARVPIHGEPSELARQFGDEPTWLARCHPDVPVYVGRDRYEAGLTLLERDPARVLVLDDAFQHRRLQRDLNIVLLDASEPLSEFALLPAGRAREGLYALKRAQIVILNKVNLADPQRAQEWRELLKARLPQSVPVFEFDYKFTSVFDPATQQTYTPEQLRDQRVFLFSGLAKPQLFERQVLEELPVQLRGHQRYKDHHVYSESDIAHVAREARDCEWMLTTEKDAVKLRAGWLGKILVAKLGLVCRAKAKEQLYEMVCAKMS